MSSNAQLTNKQRSRLVASAISISFLFLFTQFLLITAFPQIMVDFNINATQVQWLTTAFLMTITIIIPSMGYFMNRFSARALTLSALLFFIVGTIIAILSQSFMMLVIARIIQAFGAGMMLPLLQTILLIVYPINKRGYAMGLMTMVINFAPAIGPPISGLIIDAYGWRFLFWLVLPISVLFFLLNVKYMKNITKQTPTQISFTSLLLCAISLSAILLGLSNISIYGMVHVNSLGPFFLGLGVLLIFIRKQLTMNRPLLNLRLFTYPVFVYGVSISFIISVFLLSTESLLPLLIQDVQGNSAFNSGMIMFPGTVLLGISSYMAGKIYDKSGEKALLLIGFSLLFFSLILFIIIGDTASAFVLIIIFSMFMVGIGLTMTPATAVTMKMLEQTEIPDGTAILNTIRQFGSAIGVTILTTFASIYANKEIYEYAEGTAIGINLSFVMMTILSFCALVAVLIRHYKK